MKEKIKGLLKENLHEVKEDIKEDKKLAKALGSKGSKKKEDRCACAEMKKVKKKK